MNDLAKTTGLFILGSSRSGTTLLHGILQQLPYYARYQAEPMLLYQSKTKYRNINSAKAKKRFLKDWYNSRQFIRSGLTEKDFSELFNRKGITHSNLLKEFMELIALKQGCSHWIDSTPDNVFALNHIKTTFPNSKIIHMIRDGRAVSLSLAKLDWAGIQSSNMNKKLNFSALKWQLAINAAKQSIPTLGNQILEIKYEDLATKPETTLADIMFFIGHGDDLNKLNLNKVKTNSAFQDIKNGIS
ncbi:MAG TPA: sulfotransferase, partial [Gammaproteobacteria bacterium]|nr:sulfotransferase [Gammaproteobacteria bacterium]